MLVRVVLIALVALFLLMSLSDVGGSKQNPFDFDLSAESFFKNECTNQIIGMASSARAGLKYCDCVTKEFRVKILADMALQQTYTELVKEQRARAQNPRERARILSFRPGLGFRLEHILADRLLEHAQLKYPFQPHKELAQALTEGLDDHWKMAMIACTENPRLHD
jgi:hypothetical protein